MQAQIAISPLSREHRMPTHHTHLPKGIEAAQDAVSGGVAVQVVDSVGLLAGVYRTANGNCGVAKGHNCCQKRHC